MYKTNNVKYLFCHRFIQMLNIEKMFLFAHLLIKYGQFKLYTNSKSLALYGYRVLFTLNQNNKRG